MEADLNNGYRNKKRSQYKQIEADMQKRPT
jgi:hypothetical protein